jgi:hypothetical protein
MGILIPIILIVFCIIYSCQKMAKTETDPEVYYTEKSFSHQQPRLRSVSPSTKPKTMELQLIEGPSTTSPAKEELTILKSAPPPSSMEQIQILEGSPRSSTSSARKTATNNGNSVIRRTKTTTSDTTDVRQSSTSSKLQTTQYDGVYYTGEPVPGRQNIDFSDKDSETWSEDGDSRKTPTGTVRSKNAFVSPKVSV